MWNVLPFLVIAALFVAGLFLLRYMWAWMVSSRRLAIAAASIDPDDELPAAPRSWLGKIWRASCRERVC
ncbi:MAG: hypothetical protein AAFN70_21605 [Planctomycetota bacterium]